MNDRAVVVISFEGSDRFDEILQKVRSIFEEDKTAMVYGAVREPSQEILNILTPVDRNHQSERE